MKLHCLGTAGYHPNASRHTSTYFIPECGLMLDAGTGTFRVRDLIELPEISVLLSHAHLDHVIGLTFFLEFFAITSLRTVHVYAEQDKIDTIRNHLFSELLFPVEPRFHWHPLESYREPFQVGGATCHWFPLEHPGGSAGFRLNWPNVSMAYVTDTTARPNSNYIQDVSGVDLLIHECNFPDRFEDLGIKTGHSWTSAVLANAHAAKAKHLTLSHIDPSLEGSDPLCLAEALQLQPVQTPLEITVASDSLVIDLLRL